MSFVGLFGIARANDYFGVIDKDALPVEHVMGEPMVMGAAVMPQDYEEQQETPVEDETDSDDPVIDEPVEEPEPTPPSRVRMGRVARPH